MSVPPHECFRRDKLNCLINPERFTEDEATELLADEATPLLADATQIYKSSNAVSYRFRFDGRDFFAKEIIQKRAYRRLLDRVACPTAFRNFHNGIALIEQDVPTPIPALASVIETPKGARQFLVTDFCLDSHGLDTYIGQVDGEKRYTILDEIAALLADFHAKGFYSRHLRSANIMVTPGETRDYWFIDLDRLIHHRWLFYDVFASTVSRAAFEFHGDLSQEESVYFLHSCFDHALKRNIYDKPSRRDAFVDHVIAMIKERR